MRTVPILNQRTILITFLARHNIDIACITETHLSEVDVLKIPGYQVYRYDRAAQIASGGVAVLIKKKIIHHPIPNLPQLTLETIGVKIKLNDLYLTIISAYRQPKKKLNEEDLKTTFNTTEPLLMIGDLNSKNQLWGCRANNPEGNKMEAYATKYSFQIVAPEKYTYYPYRTDHLPDILDIVLQKNFDKQIYQNVIDELDSDHLPVIISFISTPQMVQPPPRLINGVIIWENFQDILDNQLKCPLSLNNHEEIDNAISNLTTSKLTKNPTTTSYLLK